MSSEMDFAIELSQISGRWGVEHLWEGILLDSIGDGQSEEAADVVGYQEEVAHQLTLVVVQVHILRQVGLAGGHEEEVSVVCTLLTANPHHPNEHDVEILDEAVLQVEDPEDHVAELDECGHLWILQSDGLQSRQRDERSDVVSEAQEDVFLMLRQS